MRSGRFVGGLLSAGLASALLVAVIVALPLGAHVERDPFFPDPAADTSVQPPAGGDFVDARPLGDPAERPAEFREYVEAAAAGGIGASERRGAIARFVRLSAGQQSAARDWLAQTGGPTEAELGLDDERLTAEDTIVVCRPDSMARLAQSLDQQTLDSNPARDATLKQELTALNQTFADLCTFDEIHPAVMAADNGDTVVVMPGFYTEPTARSKPHNDPACAQYMESGSRNRAAPTYAYHYHCPNDINMVAVIGRDLDGACIRCNVQIHGSGARPEDVLLEGGTGISDPGVSDDLFEEGIGPAHGAKEVGIRFERADGGYVGNMTIRNVSEHGFYSVETDGLTFDRVKAYYAEEYGHLSFVTDHLTVQDGDFAGSGDAGIYPGASPPSKDRLNSRIRRNRTHHNGIGLSGTMGSSLLIEDNEIDNNSAGITLDSISRNGHPGFPQNNTVMRGNRIHSNNFDTYGPDAWVESTTNAPIGAGIVIAGGNDNVVSRNHIYNNWRWGTALITVPDILTSNNERQTGDDLKLSTSHRNRYLENVMGVAPDGTEMPNGTDLWWDEMGEGNCFEDNTGPGGAPARTDPKNVPDCNAFPNIGKPHPTKSAHLVACNFAEREPNDTCDWYTVPPRPGS